jgi:hypothetical protein
MSKRDVTITLRQMLDYAQKAVASLAVEKEVILTKTSLSIWH